MTNTPANVLNYFKLELLLQRSQVVLRQLFKSRYSLFNGRKVWDDSPACGQNYYTNVVAKSKKINLTPVQKTSVSNGDSNEWDLTTLTALLTNTDRPKSLSTTQTKQLDQEDRLLKDLKDIRNTLAHHASKSIDNSEFDRLWTKLSAILVVFGEIGHELDKLKDNSIFEPHPQSINADNVIEAARLNSQATQAHKDKKYSEAIALFTKSVLLPDVPDRDRAVFYTNSSASRLALYELQAHSPNRFEVYDITDQRYRALQDAKQARTLWSTWWKGHFRVGQVYATLNEHQKAINSFERAAALNLSNDAIRKALDDSRQTYGRQMRQEHLDPRLKPVTMDEHLRELQEKLGVNPEHVRSGHSITEQIDPSGADVVRGHKYEHGDVGVKQDYELAAKYFAKAASQGNAEGMYNLARLTDRGLGVKKDHDLARKLLEQAASQPPQHPMIKSFPNLGVAEAEHALGLRYTEGVGVHKNLATAAHWYQRAVDHGSGQAANNLALMYLDGSGVVRNVVKAEELLQLSSRKDDPNAMLTLAELLCGKKDFKMAKIWYDRACDAGNIVAQANRTTFLEGVEAKEKLTKYGSSHVSRMATEMSNILDSLQTGESAATQSDRPYIYQIEMLDEYANRGSITAKRMSDALEHFMEALNMLLDSDDLTEKQEDRFVHELSQCYRIEHTVAQIPGIEMSQRFERTVDRVLQRCNPKSTTATSQLDEDVRVCYATLHMDSHISTCQFLDRCKQKYPKSIVFFELSAAVNGFLKEYKAALYDADTGLTLDPRNCDVLYKKAVALRLLGKDAGKTIEAYQAFIALAPKDHRKVPESYYATARCYVERLEDDHTMDVIKQTYQQGKKAESLQLPCFLPYKSNSKVLLKAMFDARSMLNTEPAASNTRKARLTDPHRVKVITQHREWESYTSQMKNNSNQDFISHSNAPRVKQQIAKSLIGLKPISVREMDPRKDHVYDGYVLSVRIIEEAASWTPSIHLVIEDDELNCERMFIYSFPKGQGTHLTTNVFTIGSKMSIINPYLRIGSNDMKPSIRVDDFASIIMHNESERVANLCRCCGESNAPHVCSKCRHAHYCSKECQTMDWKLYKHKLICGSNER